MFSAKTRKRMFKRLVLGHLSRGLIVEKKVPDKGRKSFGLLVNSLLILCHLKFYLPIKIIKIFVFYVLFVEMDSCRTKSRFEISNKHNHKVL